MVLSNIYETRAFIALLRHPVNITVLFGRGTHNTSSRAFGSYRFPNTNSISLSARNVLIPVPHIENAKFARSELIPASNLCCLP